MKRPTANGEPWTQLATRIKKTLHTAMKVHCVRSGIPIQDFIESAIRAKLGKGKEAAHA